MHNTMTIADTPAPNQHGVMQKIAFMARLAFLLAVVTMPLSLPILLVKLSIPHIWRGYTDISLFIPDIFVIVMLALWGIQIWLEKRKIKAGKTYIWIPLILITILGWLSIFVSVNPLISLYHAVRLSVLFLFYLYVVNEVRSFEWLIIGVALQALLQSGVAIAQYASQHSIGLSFLGEYDLDPQTSGVSVVSSGGVRYLRAYGLTDHPNILGGCIAFCLILLIASYLYGTERYAYRTISMLVLLPTGLVLLLTFSRSAWTAFLMGLLFFFIIALKKKEILLKILQIIAISLLLLSPLIWASRGLFNTRLGIASSDSVPTTEKQSISERILLLKSANEIFVKHALLGIGLGASPVALKENFPDFPYNYQPPHFTLLTSALEIGVFGALFYFILQVAPFLVFLTQYKKYLANPQALAIIALLLSINIVGLFDYYTWLLVPGRMWQWMAWALWSVVMEEGNHELA